MHVIVHVGRKMRSEWKRERHCEAVERVPCVCLKMETVKEGGGKEREFFLTVGCLK